MSTDKKANAITLQDMVEQADSGGRNPHGKAGLLLWIVALAWALFQLWYASPLPYSIGFGVFNESQARAIHLAFAFFLAYTAFPASNSSPLDRIPWYDWLFAIVGVTSSAYLLVFRTELANRSGAPIQMDIVIGCCGLILLLEATRRALGPPLMVVASVFLTYTFAGPYMPDVIAHGGASLNKVISHQWLTSEGIFGVALGVSTSFVFLFVLFGSLLDKAGAGNYFTQVSFSLLGHMRGGPAKAAVVSSGLSGLVSGSSIANVVTTGTFTIPLMKRVGFPAYKAGAVEVAASTNGQLTPPIMGAAAFLMVEYARISYIEVIQHAVLPALISYIALIYIVHLEAVKAGMKGLPTSNNSTLAQKLMVWSAIILGLCALSLGLYYGFGWTKAKLGDGTYIIATVFLISSYLWLLKFSAKFPDLEMDDPESELISLPKTAPVVKSGLYFLLPVGLLVWFLTVEQASPGLSAFWATFFMIIIVITHKPLKAWFRKEADWRAKIEHGFTDLLDGMVGGSRNMIGIAVATAAAGIVVGTVTLTGIGLKMTEFVEFISGDIVLLMLIFTAVISLILGMGLPTTANYIVVSTLMAPVIVNLGAIHGLIVPLIAVHLFVFYFGILADDTPPVGLAAFAAAAIAKSDPIKTGIQGFTYDIRTAVLPFMFIFNTELILIGIRGPFHLLMTIFGALVAMLVFAAATQGFWFVKNRWYETILLLLAALLMFRPGLVWDQIYPPIKQIPAENIESFAANLSAGIPLRLNVSGENIDGKHIEKLVELPLNTTGTGAEKIEATGMILRHEDKKVFVDIVAFDSDAQKVGIDFDWEIKSIEQETARPAKQLVWIPVLLLLYIVAVLQKRRRKLIKMAAS